MPGPGRELLDDACTRGVEEASVRLAEGNAGEEARGRVCEGMRRSRVLILAESAGASGCEAGHAWIPLECAKRGTRVQSVRCKGE
jgi:hypothetical protein